MAVAEEAVPDGYVHAPSLLEAERELDRLCGREELSVRLGDLYDELADAAAQDGEYGLAARLEAKAVDAGCAQPFLAREMRGWYLLKAGASDEGEAVFGELCAEPGRCWCPDYVGPCACGRRPARPGTVRVR